MAIQGGPDTLTPREYETQQYEKEMFEKQAAFQLEMARLETKWASLLRVPKWIILLPVFCLFGIGFIISVITKKELPEAFWKFLR